MEVVRPAGLMSPVPVAEAQAVQLLRYEMMFTKTPLAMASYPALAFRLRKASPRLLKASLSAVLAQHPVCAGRLSGTTIALTGDGVPFTVVESRESSAPDVVQEIDLLRFADFRRPGRVAKGLEPLLTVKLTCFRDGSAILGMGRSHALLDGSSAWAFLADWARSARGEKHVAARRTSALLQALPDDDQLNELAREALGRPLAGGLMASAMKVAFPLISPLYDWLFLAGITGDLTRPRVRFSDSELARIKAAATPVDGDGWVSTQEALSAYILLTIGKAALPPTSQGRAVAAFILDARKALGFRSDDIIGSGLVFLRVGFSGLLQMSLQEVAGTLHELSKSNLSQEAVRNRWRLVAGAANIGLEFDVMRDAYPTKYDICLFLNNQSKRELPDFGQEASGGAAESVLSNAGPTLVLPTRGGVEVLLDPSTLKAARSASARLAALEALRREIPVQGAAIVKASCAPGAVGSAGAGGA
mmetsp:Transcript_136233/g.353227  ORF Transcript_136233/g.353227 Transcript_136233/m.353227 type:complete len:475 (-) Transcript_136233:340-1764(-)